MTLVFAIAMGVLALAPVLAALARPQPVQRAAALCSATGCVLLVIVGVSAALGGANPVLNLGDWLGFGHSALRADGLAGIFLALTGLTGGAVSLGYAELPPGRWQTALGSTLLLFVAVAIGASNAFLFLLAWETMTVCVYLIASDGPSAADRLAGYLTGGLAKIGGAALLAAFALLYAHTHSFSLAVWAHASLPAGTRGVLFALFLTCFATKVGVVPLQGGLPAGYGSAQRLGAASLSVALCAGFYGLWRFEFQVLGPLPIWCGDALLILGGVSALAGIAYALTQDDLRRFLGYSSVEHAGIVLAGLGVALLGHAAHMPMLAAAGLLAATLQVCAHNLAKTLALITVRPRRAGDRRAYDRPARRAVAPAAGQRVHARGGVADARRDAAAGRVRQRVVHLRGAAAGLPDADAALAAAVRAGRGGACAHGRSRAARVRQVLRLRVPRARAQGARRGARTVAGARRDRWRWA